MESTRQSSNDLIIGQIKELNTQLSRWGRTSDEDITHRVSLLADAINAGMEKNEVPVDLQLKAWAVLKKATNWSQEKSFFSKKVKQNRVRGLTEENVKKCRHTLRRALVPPNAEQFDHVFTQVMPNKENRKYAEIFYRGVQLSEGTPQQMAYKHGSAESRAAFFDAIKHQNVNNVRLLLLDGVCDHWNGINKKDAIREALKQVHDAINPLPGVPVDPAKVENAWKIVEALVDAGAPLNVDSQFASGGGEPDSLLQYAVLAGRVSLVQKL
jgi:transposase